MPNFESNLVGARNREAFLSALDVAYEREERQGGKAIWLAGQQVDVETGKVSFTWSSRLNNVNRVDEL